MTNFHDQKNTIAWELKSIIYKKFYYNCKILLNPVELLNFDRDTKL